VDKEGGVGWIKRGEGVDKEGGSGVDKEGG
jgi:hypothetical protein